MLCSGAAVWHCADVLLLGCGRGVAGPQARQPNLAAIIDYLFIQVFSKLE